MARKGAKKMVKRSRRAASAGGSQLGELESVVQSLSRKLIAAESHVEIEAQSGDTRIIVRVLPALGLLSETTSNATMTVTDDDLKQGDKVPNTPEVAAVGAFVKRINRDDPDFAKLVSNANAAIVFKDEEGTGADRMMTPTLKTALDKLAILVAAEWNGVKLRVTEAWDENGEHATKSLHYEGRGADLTTSPVDGTKLGRLGRLAVNAGLGWVFFEDSSHIHVSVKA
jgi:hypothetical protein